MFCFYLIFLIYLLFTTRISSFPHPGTSNWNKNFKNVFPIVRRDENQTWITSGTNGSHKWNLLRLTSVDFKRMPRKTDENTIFENIKQIPPEEIKMALLASLPFMKVYQEDLNTKCCFNNGKCYKKDKKYLCICPPQFSGSFCENDVDECKNKTATCPDNSYCVNTYGSYNCTCQSGFIKKGTQCERQITCEEEPCLNGAMCMDGFKDRSFVCACQVGFVGKRCQFTVPECDDFSCSEQELCISTDEGFRCVPLNILQ